MTTTTPKPPLKSTPLHGTDVLWSRLTAAWAAAFQLENARSRAARAEQLLEAERYLRDHLQSGSAGRKAEMLRGFNTLVA